MHAHRPCISVFHRLLILTSLSMPGGCAAGDKLGATHEAQPEPVGESADAAQGGTQRDGGRAEMVSLRIVPSTAELVVDALGARPHQAFVAELLPSGEEVAVRWQVEGDLVGVDDSGVVTAQGIAGGSAILTARYGDQTAQAEIRVRVDLVDTSGAGTLAPGQRAALDGVPVEDPGNTSIPPNPTKILYPYDGTVIPRGLTAPLLQLSPGSLPPQDVKMRVQAKDFSWTGYARVEAPLTPRIALPQDIWAAALVTAKGKSVRVSVVKAVDGVAYGPADVEITAADGTLKGAVYYMTYAAEAVGLWSVRPGDGQPARHIVQGCVVCHSASSNGTRLSTGADLEAEAARSGVYTVGANGEATQMTGAPADFGGDSRGLSFATFTPDGRYVMRSKNNFWGGPDQRAFFIDDAANALVEATVVGLGSEVSAYLPAFSHDGKNYAFTNGAGETSPVGTSSRSLSIMNVSIDEAAGPGGTLTFSDRKVLLDNGIGGSVVKFATFMPDSNQIAFQEGEGYTPNFDEMLPTWGEADSTFRSSTGRLAMVHADSKAYTRLARLNQGQVALDADRNYEPFTLPVSAGGYFWVVFTSTREYGNMFTGEAVRKQLWVAAISPSAAAGQDPSHPPFYLPNQGDTPNERGFWALEPCRANGLGCASGDECCDGFCRPADAEMPQLGKVCQPPEDGMCADLHERCAVPADCCQVAEFAQCIGGYCDIPAPI